VSDAADKAGLPACGLYHIRSAIPQKSCCGQAFTVHYVPCGSVKGTMGDFLDDVEPGQVVVIDNSGRDTCTVWGDIMSLVASMKGVAGTVIDGVCRDLPAIEKMGYPIYSKGCYMVTGKDRVFVDAVNVPIAVSGLQVVPGDIVMADDSGAIRIPLDHAMRVLEVAEGIASSEAQIEALVRSGMPLKGARKQTGYHKLQTHESKEE
jgi:4-hydroxy-4-methyl-2-oxoglutarate aldolase